MQIQYWNQARRMVGWGTPGISTPIDSGIPHAIIPDGHFPAGIDQLKLLSDEMNFTTTPTLQRY